MIIVSLFKEYWTPFPKGMESFCVLFISSMKIHMFSNEINNLTIVEISEVSLFVILSILCFFFSDVSAFKGYIDRNSNLLMLAAYGDFKLLRVIYFYV